MDFQLFGIGPFELTLIVIIALLIFGPKELLSIAKRLGQLRRQLTQSESLRKIQQLPDLIMQETKINEVTETLKQVTGDVQKATTLDLPADAKQAWGANTAPTPSIAPPPPPEPPKPSE
jgi:Sec-independent protein translocase protein TatA